MDLVLDEALLAWNVLFDHGEVTGVDIWGLLYSVKYNDIGGDADKPTIRFLDVQRLGSEDFPYFFHQYVERSENGRVVCVETGVAENPGHCTPTILTLGLNMEKGIMLHRAAPLAWPSPSGLEDTYGPFLRLTPAGDYLLASYEDKGDIDALVFYKYSNEKSAGNSCGTKTNYPPWKCFSLPMVTFV